MLVTRGTVSSGVLLIFAGVVIIFGIITGEIFFHGYSTRNNIVSDLGQRTDPFNASNTSSWIFNTAMIVAGIAIAASAYFLHNATHNNIVALPLALHGIATAGIGIFNSDIKGVHFIFAIATFLTVEFAAVASFSFTDSPIKFIFAALGIIGFLFLVLNPIAKEHFGLGGAERWIIYPTTIWLLTFGAYLLGSNNSA